MQNKMEGEFFLQLMRTSSADLTHLPLDCPASEPLGAPYFTPLRPFLTFGPDLVV